MVPPSFTLSSCAPLPRRNASHCGTRAPPPCHIKYANLEFYLFKLVTLTFFRTRSSDSAPLCRTLVGMRPVKTGATDGRSRALPAKPTEGRREPCSSEHGNGIGENFRYFTVSGDRSFEISCEDGKTIECSEKSRIEDDLRRFSDAGSRSSVIYCRKIPNSLPSSLRSRKGALLPGSARRTGKSGILHRHRTARNHRKPPCASRESPAS